MKLILMKEMDTDHPTLKYHADGRDNENFYFWSAA